MTVRGKIVLWLALLAIAGGAVHFAAGRFWRTPPPPAVLPAPSGEFFPMAPGTRWDYEGTVEWTSPSGGRTQKTAVTCTMEVVSRHKVGAFEAAVVHGHPADLADAAWNGTEKAKPGTWLAVRSPRGRCFRVAPFDAAKNAGLLSSPKTLSDRCTEEALFAFPGMHKGDFWSADAETAPRADGFYRWNVEEGTRAQTTGGATVAVYALAFRTNPDHTIAEFAPGLGLTRWRYAHHGTVAECDLRLVKFTPGTGAMASRPAAVRACADNRTTRGP